MSQLRHTVNVACALNLVILDDHGQPVRALICPLILLFLHLPAWLYNLVSSWPSPHWGGQIGERGWRGIIRWLTDIEPALHGDLYQLIFGLRLPYAAG